MEYTKGEIELAGITLCYAMMAFRDELIEVDVMDCYRDTFAQDILDIVEMHNKWDAFEAMEKALEAILREYNTDPNDDKFYKACYEARKALSLARGESKSKGE